MSNVITVREITQHNKRLRLHLKREAEEISCCVPKGRDNSFTSLFTVMLTQWVGKAEEGIAESAASPECTKRNRERIEKSFNEVQGSLTDLKNATISALGNLTPQQQEEVVTFWNKAGSFLRGVLDWMRDIFTFVLGLSLSNP